MTHGDGGFAIVHKGMHSDSGQVIAIKIIKKLNVETLRVSLSNVQTFNVRLSRD